MKRIDTATKVTDKFGAGKHGFTNGVPGVTPTTELDAAWFDSVQEEIATVIESAGAALNPAVVTQLRDAIIALAGVPVGTIIYTAMSTAPAGSLKANGAVVSQTTYPALYAKIGATYNTGGEGAGNFRLPDLRAEFVRGWDDSRGVDSGRVFGSNQGDDFKSHVHTDNTSSVNGGSLNRAYANNANASTGFQFTTATGGTETRPRNVALLACIKY